MADDNFQVGTPIPANSGYTAPTSPNTTQDDNFQVGKTIPPSSGYNAATGSINTPPAPTGHHVTDTAFGQTGPGMSLKGMGNAVVSGVGGALAGAGEGVFSTAAGGADLLNKIPGVHIPTQGLHELAGDNEQKTTSEKVGYGGETLTEFILGDEALKGLTQSDKLLQAAKTMKFLEKSPKTIAALKIGAQALRMGTVQGAQTLVRTGGDTGEALKQGGEMAATAGVLGTRSEERRV